MSEPKPPEGVRVVTEDGREWPCEVTYAGRNPSDLFHEWEAWPPKELVNVDHTLVDVRIDVLPAHTSVAIRLRYKEA